MWREKENGSKEDTINYGKSAMSKARIKISPELFIDLNKVMLDDIYGDKEEVKQEA